MKLTVFQADKGDCLLLESAGGKRILIDGGTSSSFKTHVAPALGKLRDAGQALDLVYLSHIDDDHIGGVLALFDAEIAWRVHEFQLRTGNDHHPEPKVPRPPVVARALAQRVLRAGRRASAGDHEPAGGHGRGARLRRRRRGPHARRAPPRDRHQRRPGHPALAPGRAPSSSGIPLNRAFDGKLALVRDGQGPVALGSLSLTVLGPFEQDLEALRKEWSAWLAGNQAPAGQDPRADARRRPAPRRERGRAVHRVAALQAGELGDRKQVTAPNLASLMLLAEEDGKRVLLTGDGHADDILKGLEQAGHHTLHVDVLKLQHHGSEFNITQPFCERVTADRYVITGNGAHANPDLRALDADHRRARRGRLRAVLQLEPGGDRQPQRSAHMAAGGRARRGAAACGRAS